MIWFVGFVLLLYCLALICFGFAFIWGVYFSRSKNIKKQAISILIPFHNEKENLPQLIKSLNKLNYSKKKFEVILINDCSTDKVEEWLETNEQMFEFPHFIVNLTKKAGKKTAIEKGLMMCSYDRIVTTDADCTFSKNWLNQISTTDHQLSIGVTLKQSKNFGILSKFQEVESMMLAGITLGSAAIKNPILSTGANLSYRKKDFNKLSPYSDNKHIPSGDDMFLLAAMLKGGKSYGIRYKNPVITSVKTTWKSYLAQTTRWAAKTKYLEIKGLKIFSSITFLANIFWILSLVLWILTKENIFVTLAIIKSAVDILFLFLTSLAFKRTILLLYAPIMAITYPFYLLLLAGKILTYKESWSENG